MNGVQSPLTALLVVTLAAIASAQTTREVPAVYANIQAAIDAAVTGDTIMVAAGTFVEPNEPYYGNGLSAGPNVYNKSDLHFIGAGPGQSIIDLDGHYYGFIFSRVASNCIVEGFTIRNGGVNMITNYNASIDNTFRNCVLETAPGTTNSFRTYEDGMVISECTFIGHVSATAIYSLGMGMTVRNCIFSTYSRLSNDLGSLSISYSNLDAVGGSQPVGLGLIAADPMFVDAPAGDFHLKSTGGHWTAGGFVLDMVKSSSIDAGDPGDPVGAETAPNGGIINLGAFGGTLEASRTSPACQVTLCADCDGNGVVDILDALHCARLVAGLALLPTPGSPQFSACNTHGVSHPDPTASLDVLDALEIARDVAGLITAMCC